MGSMRASSLGHSSGPMCQTQVVWFSGSENKLDQPSLLQIPTGYLLCGPKSQHAMPWPRQSRQGAGSRGRAAWGMGAMAA